MSRVEIVEVGPRDGLQNDPARLNTVTKAEFASRVAAAGVGRVEIASFVNPSKVPQMADAAEVCAALADTPGRWIGLVLNERGFDRALAAGIPEVNVVVVCSDTFSQRNQGMTTSDALTVATRVATRAHEHGITPTVTLAAAFGCPYEGTVPLPRVLRLAAACLEAGMSEISLADTVGAAVPREVTRRVSALRSEAGSVSPLRVHLHNTRNAGYANALAAVEAGADSLDASLGGIGGCPFAPKATGNIATEDLVWLLESNGVETGVSLPRLLAASEWLEQQLGRPTPGLVVKAGPFPPE